MAWLKINVATEKDKGYSTVTFHGSSAVPTPQAESPDGVHRTIPHDEGTELSIELVEKLYEASEAAINGQESVIDWKDPSIAVVMHRLAKWIFTLNYDRTRMAMRW